MWNTDKSGVAYLLQEATPKFKSGRGIEEWKDASGEKLFDSGASTDIGSNQVITWGRWTGGSSKVRDGGTGKTDGSIATLHYFMVTAGPGNPISAPFTSMASTAPTVVSGGKLVATGSANGASGSFTAALTLAGNGSASYTLTVPVSGQTFTLTGNATQTSINSFAGVSVITSTGSGCNGGCTGNLGGNISVIGQLAGSAGTHAGVLYGFDSRLGDVSGVIIFKR